MGTCYALFLLIFPFPFWLLLLSLLFWWLWNFLPLTGPTWFCAVSSVGSLYLTIFSSFEWVEWNNFFSYGFCYFSDSMFFSLKLRLQQTLPFIGGHTGCKPFSHKPREEESHMLCLSWRAMQFCSDSKCCLSSKAVCLVLKRPPICVLNKTCFLLKTFLCAGVKFLVVFNVLRQRSLFL